MAQDKIPASLAGGSLAGGPGEMGDGRHNNTYIYIYIGGWGEINFS